MNEKWIADGPNIELLEFPKITVITPSYNQGHFLEETIRSVIDQRYPNLEYFVVDGGSTDNSVEVIKQFESHIDWWVSEKDSGQANAINKGLQRATGEIVIWCNSDDVFLPGALNAAAFEFLKDSNLQWLAGSGLKYSERGHRLDPYIADPIQPTKIDWLIACWISQTSSFWKRSLVEQVGGMDEAMHYGFDYEYWVRLAFHGVQLRHIARPMMAQRLHGASKTVAFQERFRKDEQAIRDKYVGKLSAQDAAAFKRRYGLQEASAGYAEIATVTLASRGKAAALAQWKQIGMRYPSSLFSKSALGTLRRIIFNRPR